MESQKQIFVVQCSHYNIEKWKEWPKKALLEELMSELSIKGSEKEKIEIRETGDGIRGPTGVEQEQRHVGEK